MVVAYAGFVAVTLAVAAGVRWFQPAVVGQLARRTGVSGVAGWAVTVVAALWVFLPVLAGARTGEGELWLVGAAIASVGWYLTAVAAGSIDEYRLLRGARRAPPGEVTPGQGVVATAGRPSPADGTARTPFTGAPAVHVDWLVQRRRRIGLRRGWVAVAGGVRGTPFTTGDGAVAVPESHRVVTDAERVSTVDPDESLPEAAAQFLREHPELPDPDGREDPLRLTERFLPADGPVTVVGVPRQGERPGQSLIDRSAPDERGTGGDASGEDAGPALLRGDVDTAGRTLHRRVRWLGAAGAGMILGGQVLAFGLSAATLPVAGP